MSERNIKSHYYPLLLVAAAGLPRRRKQWNAFVFKKSRLILKSMQINTDNIFQGPEISYISSKVNQVTNHLDRD